MSNDHVHPIFRGLINSIAPKQQHDEQAQVIARELTEEPLAQFRRELKEEKDAN